MDKVVESIRIVKSPLGLRSQERAASPPARLRSAVALVPRTAPVGKSQGPPGRPCG